MKIFVWVQPEILHKEFHLSKTDKFILNLIKADFFTSFDITVGTCTDSKSGLKNVLFADYKPLVIKSKGTIIDTMTDFLINKFHPDILIAAGEQGEALSDNLGYPPVILPPKIDLLNEIFQKKIWKDVGINLPFSVLIREKSVKKSYGYKKSLIFTDNLEKTVMEIVKQGINE